MNLNISKLLKIAGFLIVMFISTWATVESIYRLVEWPKIIIWPLSILFFWAAAVGVKNIITCFDYSERIMGRFKYLVGGIILVTLFWLGLILPTNTHTFFYKREIKPTCLKELKDTETTLMKLKSQGRTFVEKEKSDFKTKTNALITNFKAELLDPDRPGHKERAEKVLIEIDELLGTPVQRLKKPSNTTFTVLNNYGNRMENTIRSQLEIKLGEFDSKSDLINSRLDENNLNKTLNDLRHELENYNQEPSNATKRVLLDGFGMINRYSEILSEQLPSLEPFPKMKIPKTIELENIFKTWGSFFNGEYTGKGYWYFILGATLVDLLGFFLYHLATRKENY